MITYTIYVVDDEQTIREGITMALESDYRMRAFITAESALKAIEKKPPDLVLLDIGLPGMSGIEALKEIKRLYPHILIIMITAYEDINTVISAMKSGAYDYVVKPIHMEGLEVTIRNAFQTIRLRKEVQILQEKYLKENLPCFIAESNAIQNVMEFIDTVAKSPDTPILIMGETGTGKELLASAIHYRSPNFKGPLMTVNCAAIPKDLIESELFGYEKGAFSGASTSGKKGLIEEAANGTLFLDEIGDLSFEAQAKLLRFLEEGEFYRVGGTKKIHVKTRVVSATNKNLDRMMEEGQFRKDLFFRLSVIKVQVPTLNERPDDILALAKHFLYEFSQKFGKEFTGISSQAQRALEIHNWTGNVRELKNIMERGVLVGKGPILQFEDLGLTESPVNDTFQPVKDEFVFPPLSETGIDLSKAQESLEKYYIQAALRMAKGNESKAAKLLNINHHTFRYRRKKLRIT
ncbi:MAG: sigma-54-dependent Fis family transcriptional regulator [Deltaproteobacteria bacterium]|nr:sigma-54-dependent Fis family transcriptional regulator [Deltaproteobacteria bacterium]MBW2151287.1 sigma-54-dependent Fis family transcriptional regulator [Deltaproteobacteria bacterium]